MKQPGRGGEPARQPKGGLFDLRKTWKKMNEWGDEFERKHFNGDFVGAVSKAPKKTFEAMSNWGDEIERTHFNGDFVGTVSEIVGAFDDDADYADTWLVDGTVGNGGGAVWPPAPVGGATDASYCSGDSGMPARAATFSASPAATALPAALRQDPWEARAEVAAEEAAMNARMLGQAQAFKQDIARERALHRSRAAACQELDAELQELRAALVGERQACLGAEAASGVAEAGLDRARLGLERLLLPHHQLLSRQAALEAEARAIQLDREADEAWARQAPSTDPREWARDGPETDALMEAKVVLADLLMEVDETRHWTRRELQKLNEKLEEEGAINAELRRGCDGYAGSVTIFQSIRTLVKIARGQEVRN